MEPSPISSTAAVGATVSRDITVTGIAADPGLGGYDISVDWDPAIVQLDSLSDTGFLASSGNVMICPPASISNATGTAEASCTTLPLFNGPGVSASEPTALLRASFTAKAAGTSQLHLHGTLSSPSNAAIAAAFVDGTIQVEASNQATSVAPTSPSSVQTPIGTKTSMPVEATAVGTQALPAPFASGTPSDLDQVVGELVGTAFAGVHGQVNSVQPPAAGDGSGGGGGFPLLTVLSVAVVGLALMGVVLGGRHFARRRG